MEAGRSNRTTFLISAGIVLLVLLAAHLASADERVSIGKELQAILAPVEARVTTGFLYDRVVPLSSIDRYDGRSMAPAISSVEWRQIYDEMRRASLEPLSWPPTRDLRRSAAAVVRRGVFPIAVLDVTYERIRSDAVQKGVIEPVSGRLVVSGPDVLSQHRVVAAAPLHDVCAHGGAVTFVVESAYYFADSKVLPVRIEVDLGDGIGFREVQFGEHVYASYPYPGVFAGRVRVTDGKGDVQIGAFRFEVTQLQAPLPNDTLAITASLPYDGVYGTGEAYVYLADGRTSLANPVVVVEGFDLDNTMNWNELYELLNQESLVETIRADGYDLVVLNFSDATDFIQRNAFVVEALIEQTANLIDPSADLVVVGASMGGLAARYALADMEARGKDHHTRTFISFDAPHRGANIPLGLQYWLDFFSGQSAEAAYLLERLDTPAARQMLVYHHTDPPSAGGDADVLRAAFLSDLANVGGYPGNTRLVAIANGSGAGSGQGFVAGAQIIDYEYSSLLVDIVGNVWAVPDGSSQLVFDGLIDIILLPQETMAVTVSGTIPYDNAPGGSRSSMAQMDSTQAPYGDIVALHDNHCFIPTVSALDIELGLFDDLTALPDPASLSPFDAVYFPVENQPHVTITPESALWIGEEIAPAATAVRRGAKLHFPRLLGAMPNPFGEATTLRLDLSVPGRVEAAVFSVEGKRVATLFDRDFPAGSHTFAWDGRDAEGRPVATGVYFCRVRTGGYTVSRRMIRVR